MQHFAIDLLSEYGTEEIPETTRPVVNPARRALDQQRRSLQSRLLQRQARYAGLTLHPESDPAEVAEWERDKAELVDHKHPPKSIMGLIPFSSAADLCAVAVATLRRTAIMIPD